MILPLLVAASAIFPGRFVELPMPASDTICISVVAPTGELDPRESGIVRVLARMIPQGALEYPKSKIDALTIPTGHPLTCTVMPDHLCLQADVPAAYLREGLDMVHTLIEKAYLNEEDLDQALGELPFAKNSYWKIALDPMTIDFEKIDRRDIFAMYQKLFQPANLSIAVSGPFADNEARDLWLKYYEDWKPQEILHPRTGLSAEARPMQALQPITTIEVAGTEFKGSDATLPDKLLAIFALGVGKDSTVFRVIRQKLRISYRQEAFLWPTAAGFRPRIIVAVKPRNDEDGLGGQIKSAVLGDVDTWNEATRLRALAMAQAVYGRGLPLDPLVLQTAGNVGLSQDDRTFMTAYWPLKTGQYWIEANLLTSLNKVTLDEMRKAAKDMFGAGMTRIISGG